MGTKMENAPIYFALAQVRFNTLLLLEQKYLPTIQDGMRKAGYPDFRKMLVAAISISSDQAMVPAVQPQARYEFINGARTSGFILDQGQLAFQTTDYDTSPTFFALMMGGLKIVHEAAELDYSDRIGVRFLDAICPRQGEKIGQYLAPELMGIAEKLESRTLVQSISETRTKRDQNTLVSKAVVLQQDGRGASFPDEFGPMNVQLKSKFAEITGRYAILDNDCWFEGREKFDLATLEKRMISLHLETRTSFDLMVTPHALSVWE